MSVPALRHWLAGLALSLLVAWAAGALLLNTVQPVALDMAVGRYMPEPGTTTRHRSEGFARTTVGEHGFRSLPEGVLPPGPKIMFWGDSYVEALQVDDAAHMDQALSRLAAQDGLNLFGVGVGVSGDSIIDSLFRLPMYSKALAPVALHVFVVSDITDVMPDIPNDTHSEFRSTPTFRLTYATASYPENHLKYGWLVRRLDLSGPYHLFKSAMSLSLRLAPGPAAAPVPQHLPVPPPHRLDQAWDFLLTQLKQQAPEPMMIVYLPPVPQLRAGTIRTGYDDLPLAEAFGRACARQSIPFLNLGSAFVAHYQATGRFPRGFFNSPPGLGHLNDDGHRLVAEAVLQHVKEHRDALLAP